MTTEFNNELKQAQERIEQLEEALNPKSKPCGCCIRVVNDECWICDCDCGNRGDYAEATNWCRQANQAVRLGIKID